ncbi:MAG: hypothetical protein MGF17_03575 [Trichodesmium sp. MAG_R04]|nr:hypothetical protein [Trichodesmium sp. MAG_R04]
MQIHQTKQFPVRVGNTFHSDVTAPSEHKSLQVIEDVYNAEVMKEVDWHMINAINKYLEIDIPLDNRTYAVPLYMAHEFVFFKTLPLQ